MSEILHDTRYEYPYSSYLTEKVKSGKFQSYTQPDFSLGQELRDRKGAFLEIGGPSDYGYFHLDGLKLDRPIAITNIDRNSLPAALNPALLKSQIDFLMDGTNTGLSSESVGLVLSSHLNIVKKEEETDVRKIKGAESALREAVNTGELTDELMDHYLPLEIAAEVYRILEPGGLYLTDGEQNAIAAFQMLGFQLREWVEQVPEKGGEPYYYVVLQKLNPAREFSDPSRALYWIK